MPARPDRASPPSGAPADAATARAIIPPPALLETRPADWLREALERLVAVTDRIADAVVGHDLTTLEAAVAGADQLVAAIDGAGDRLAAARHDPDFLEAAPRLRHLRELLRANGRRNGHLIQRAWELDAAAVRLLIRIVAPEPERPTAAYASPAPRLLDTSA